MLEEGRASPRRAAVRAAVSPGDLAWILLLPVVLVAVPAITLLAPVGGRLLLPDPGYHYWPEVIVIRKAAIDVGYVLFVLTVFVYAGAIVRFAGVRMRPVAQRVLVALAQVGVVAFVVVCWVAQWNLISSDQRRVYFTPATLAVAAVLTAAAWGLARLWRRRPPRELLALRQRIDARVVSGVCLGVAVLATVVWLLPAIHTDSSTPGGPAYLGALFLDESTAVLNGRSPLVNMVAYASVWPYVVAIPLWAFDGTYAAFTVTMATITGVALLAVYGVLRRVTRSSLLALALYLPVLAMGFYVEEVIGGDRYDPGTYFGMFPLRYAGPYLLAWLAVWQLGRPASSRWSLRLLFVAAGLVAINNLDFGVSALLATACALVVVRRPRDRAALGRLAFDVGAGLALALALVSLLTLVRAGSLPHLSLLTRYGRVFVNGGAVNLPLPGLGLHLVISATFVAAGALAAVRVARGEREDLLGAMLAWCAIFGFGASLYYYAYRSHPDVLITLFSIWSLTLALLTLAAFRETRERRWPGVPALVVTFGFALAACSIAQVASPWGQVRRIAGTTPVGTRGVVPAGGFLQAPVTGIVAERTHRGERVVILSQVGHRVARDAGVVNVSPYAGLEQMPAREQLDEVVGILRREGGRELFVAQLPPQGLDEELSRLGFRLRGRWNVNPWSIPTISEYRSS